MFENSRQLCLTIARYIPAPVTHFNGRVEMKTTRAILSHPVVVNTSMMVGSANATLTERATVCTEYRFEDLVDVLFACARV